MDDNHQDQLKECEGKLQVVLSSVRRAQNALRPVNRLPPEVLANIFALSQPEVSSFLPFMSLDANAKLRDWLASMLVCRHWHDTILSFPYLWSAVHSAGQPHLFLERSCSSPLRIYLGLRGPGINESLFEKAIANVSRFQEFHLDLSSWNGDTPLLQLLDSPAPLLESLTIVTDWKTRIDPVLPTIFKGQTPKLRQLTLENFTSWPGNQFQNLTHLCLHDQFATNRPTLAQFLDFLQSCPQMEELGLVNAGPTDVDDLSDTSVVGRTVALDVLRELDIGDWPSAESVSRFLTHILIPQSTNLYIWGDRIEQLADDIISVIPDDCSNLGNMANLEECYFIRQSGVVTSFVAVENKALYIFGSIAVAQVLPNLFRYPLHNVRHAIIRDTYLVDGRIPLQSWSEILGAMKNLKKLSIYGWQATRTTRTILSALRPSGADSSPSKLICPFLEALCIEDERAFPSLFVDHIAKARAALGSPLQQLSVVFPDENISTPVDGSDDEGVFKPSEDLLLLRRTIGTVSYEIKEPGFSRVVPLTWPTPVFQWTRD